MAKRIKKELSGHWYTDLTPEGRAQYHRDHPNSRMGLDGQQGGATPANKPFNPNATYTGDQIIQMALSYGLKSRNPTKAQTSAMDPALSLPDMKLAVKHKDASVRKAFAMNPKCPAMFLESLCEDEDHTVVHAALTNANTPKHVLSKVFKERGHDPYMQEKIVSNPNCPREIFEKVMVTGSSRAQQAIASNMLIGDAPLVHLSNSSDPAVLRNLAMNEKTPRNILQKLATNPDPEVSDRAKKNASTRTDAQINIDDLLRFPRGRWNV